MCRKPIISLLFLLASVCISSLAKAQEEGIFYFDNRVDHILENAKDMIYSSHQFGDHIAKKIAIVDDTYTFVTPGDPSSPGYKTTVQKPVIFNAIKKLNSYYRKQVKGKHMTMADATIKLDHVLDVGISVFAQPSSDFESELRKNKKPEELIKVFERVVLK